MSITPPNIQYTPPIDDENIPPAVQVHLKLIYERLQNHFVAVGNLQKQINAQKPVTK